MHTEKNDGHSAIYGPRSASLLGRVFLGSAFLGGAFLISGCDQSPQATYRVVRADTEQLTVTGDSGELKRSFKVVTDTKVTVDGEPASVMQLEVGDEVAVTTELLAGEDVATEIRGVSRERLDGGDVPPTLPADISPGEARDTSLHGLELPADTSTLSQPGRNGTPDL